MKINPCPFCGALAEFDNNGPHMSYVECSNEDCLLFGPGRDTEAEAVAAWNSIRVEKEGGEMSETNPVGFDYVKTVTNAFRWVGFSWLVLVGLVAGGVLLRAPKPANDSHWQRAVVAEADEVVRLRDIHEDARAFRVWPPGIVLPFCEGCVANALERGVSEPECINRCDADGDLAVTDADLDGLRQDARERYRAFRRRYEQADPKQQEQLQRASDRAVEALTGRRGE